MLIRGMDIDINFLEEIDPFLCELGQYKVKGDRLIACSPFRQESKPSFAVNIENGSFIDSGCIEDEWHKGNFIRLLSFFRQETYYDTEEYLLHKYNIVLADADRLNLNFTLQLDPERKILPQEMLQQYAFRHPYLTNRGILENIQRGFKIGYEKSSRAVVFPVFDKNNNLVNLKFRKVEDKRFWYLKDGQPVKQHLFGLNHVYRKNAKKVWIVEGETDCMYLWSHGFPAIATFGASLTEKQKNLILASPIEHLVLAVDNDAVGRDFAIKLGILFGGILEISEHIIPDNLKDVNEMPPNLLIQTGTDLRTLGLRL